MLTINYIYYYRSYTYLINYRKGGVKRQLHFPYQPYKKRPTSKEVGLYILRKSKIQDFQFDIC